MSLICGANASSGSTVGSVDTQMQFQIQFQRQSGAIEHVSGLLNNINDVDIPRMGASALREMRLPRLNNNMLEGTLLLAINRVDFQGRGVNNLLQSIGGIRNTINLWNTSVLETHRTLIDSLEISEEQLGAVNAQVEAFRNIYDILHTSLNEIEAGCNNKKLELFEKCLDFSKAHLELLVSHNSSIIEDYIISSKLVNIEKIRDKVQSIKVFLNSMNSSAALEGINSNGLTENKIIVVQNKLEIVESLLRNANAVQLISSLPNI